MTRKQKAAIRGWRNLNWGLIVALSILTILYMIFAVSAINNMKGIE